MYDLFVFDRAFIAVPCPRCQYEIDVQFRSVQLEDMILCACCKVQIQLVDNEASGHMARRDSHIQLRNLQRELQRMSRTLTINI